MKTGIFEELLCCYAGGNDYTAVAPEHLSRDLTKAERDQYAELANHVGRLSTELYGQRAQSQLVADLGPNIVGVEELGPNKVAVQIDHQSAGELTAAIFVTQPNVLHPVRNVDGISIDIGKVSFSQEATQDGSSLEDLAVLCLLHDALRKARPVTAGVSAA